MQWEEISDEEVKALKLSSRSNGRDSQYKELLDAVKGGKTVKVKLEEGMKPKTMAQRLYTAAKAADMTVIVRTTADNLAVVVSKGVEPKKEEPAPPPAEPEGQQSPPEGEPPADAGQSKKK